MNNTFELISKIRMVDSLNQEILSKLSTINQSPVLPLLNLPQNQQYTPSSLLLNYLSRASTMNPSLLPLTSLQLLQQKLPNLSANDILIPKTIEKKVNTNNTTSNENEETCQSSKEESTDNKQEDKSSNLDSTEHTNSTSKKHEDDAPSSHEGLKLAPIRVLTSIRDDLIQDNIESSTLRRKAPQKPQPKRVIEYEDEEFSSEEDEELVEEEPDELFKPTKHVYYLAKNTIKTKRVMPKRCILKEEEKPKISTPTNDMEVVQSMLDDIKGILGISEVNQSAVYSILVKSDNDPSKVLTKIRRNLCYYRRVLSMN